MKRLTTLLVIAIVWGNLTSRAAVKNPKPAKAEVAKKAKATKQPEKVQDYSRGFAQFKSFGLPDVKAAKYIKLNSFTIFNLVSSGRLPYAARAKGNAWLIKEDKKHGKALVIINQGTVVDIYDQQKLIKESQKKNKKSLPNWNSELNNYLSGTWKKVDLKTDAKKMITYLKQKLKKQDDYVDDSTGGLFLFAAQLHNKGLKADANKIVALLFKITPNKRQVLLAALNTLADAQYNTVYLQFHQDHNLKKFSANIAPLLKRYPIGWGKAPGVKKLQTLLQAQLNGKKVTTSYKKLNATEKKLATALITEKLEPFAHNLWLLPPQVKSKTAKPASPKAATIKKSEKTKKTADTKSAVIANITDCRMAAVPMLIGLLDDNSFVMIGKDQFNQTSTRYNYLYGMFGSNRNDGDDSSEANKIFNRMPRPMTRGEVAKNLLQAIIIMEVDESNSGNAKSPEEFKTLCLAWYKKNKNKNPIELATIYLKNGNNSQKVAAADYLLASNAKKQYILVEQELLAGKRERYGNQTRDMLAIKYVRKRGDKATGFVEKYIKKLDPDGSLQQEEADKKNKKKNAKKAKNKKRKVKKTPKGRGDGMFVESNGSDDIEQRMSTWEKQEILGQIKKLRMLASNKTAEEILNDVVEKRKDWNRDLAEIIMTRMRDNKRSPDEQLTVWLTAADKFTKIDNGRLVDQMFQQALQSIKPNARHNYGRFSAPPNIQPASTAPAPSVTKNRQLWEKLLKNKMKLAYNNTGLKIWYVGDLAAFYNELIYGKTKRIEMAMADRVLEDLYLKRLHKRVAARLSGTADDKLPKLPTISKLKQPELKSQIAAVMQKLNATAGLKDLQQGLASLSLNELLLLAKGLDNAPKLNALLVVLANKITNIKTKVKSAEKFKKFMDKQLSKSLVDELQRYALDRLKNNRPISCKIVRKPCFAGCTITITEIPLKNLTKEKSEINKKFILAGYIDFPGAGNPSAIWDVDAKAVAAVKISNNDAEEDDDDDLFNEVEDEIDTEAKNAYAENQQQFADKLLQIEQGKENTLLSGNISFGVKLKQYTLQEK